MITVNRTVAEHKHFKSIIDGIFCISTKPVKTFFKEPGLPSALK